MSEKRNSAIFSEIYGESFKTMHRLLNELENGSLNAKEIRDIVYRNIQDPIMAEEFIKKIKDWDIVYRDNESGLFSSEVSMLPDLPLTNIEKRWMKAIFNDPKMSIFGLTDSGLEDVEPLYQQDTFVYYDMNGDGDNFGDKTYRQALQNVMYGIEFALPIKVTYTTRGGKSITVMCMPRDIEFSQKDNKLRVLASSVKEKETDTVQEVIINVDSIASCEVYKGKANIEYNIEPDLCNLIIRIKDERNALERITLSFSGFEKQVDMIGDNLYEMQVVYNKNDELEMLIRILSFGPLVEILKPSELRQMIKERIEKQIDKT